MRIRPKTLLAIVLVAFAVALAVAFKFLWSPAEPLRFRYVSREVKMEPGREAPSNEYFRFEVSNPNRIDVHLSKAALYARSGSPGSTSGMPLKLAEIDFTDPHGSERTIEQVIAGPPPVTVPGRGTVKGSAELWYFQSQKIEPPMLEIVYEWTTDTRQRVGRFCEGLAIYLPESMGKHLTGIGAPEYSFFRFEPDMPSPSPSSASPSSAR